ncbi:hypothetical protein [Kribbella sp. VKM Ac-2569]|nr:hypothetical protein [Kribbella sp. VKM Ac-2569]
MTNLRTSAYSWLGPEVSPTRMISCSIGPGRQHRFGRPGLP